MPINLAMTMMKETAVCLEKERFAAALLESKKKHLLQRLQIKQELKSAQQSENACVTNQFVSDPEDASLCSKERFANEYAKQMLELKKSTAEERKAIKWKHKDHINQLRREKYLLKKDILNKRRREKYKRKNGSKGNGNSRNVQQR